jgi:prevent-host-death family protein
VAEISVSEFKDDVGRCIDLVESGEVLTVTRRGKPVARMVPAAPARASDAIVLRGDGPLASDYVREGRR